MILTSHPDVAGKPSVPQPGLEPIHTTSMPIRAKKQQDERTGGNVGESRGSGGVQPRVEEAKSRLV